MFCMCGSNYTHRPTQGHEFVRLVPAEESDSWELLKRIKELENVIGVLFPREMAAQHKRLEEEVEKAFREGHDAGERSGQGPDDEQFGMDAACNWQNSRARRVATGEEVNE